jgi:FkbM family methyltransferase
MGALRRAVAVARRHGLRSLVSRAAAFALDGARRRLSVLVYRTKATVLNDHTVSVNGVRLDLDDDAISASMVGVLRRGAYEMAETELLHAHLRPDLPVVDVGAGLGYTTCLIDRHTGDVPVVGLEANEAIAATARRTRQLNDAEFDVVHAAYDPVNRSVEFRVAENFWVSSTVDGPDADDDTVSVPATSLAALVADRVGDGPFQLVADIEGGETGLVDHELSLLRDRCAVLVVEFHPAVTSDISSYVSALTDAGFEHAESTGEVHVFVNERWREGPG